MTYQDTIDWMFIQLPMYQQQGKVAYKKDLFNIIKLCNYLNNPEKKFKSIHIAGTNGKGSTSHMAASILQESGLTVGLYTSPHLKDFRERIKINGKLIPKQSVVKFIKQHKLFFKTNKLSFFEMTVGMAFNYFAQQNVDIAVVEVGMGGRLDSTNILLPEVAVITNIGLDHTQFLGDTLQLISKEKAGIIKQNTPVVIGETQPETVPIFNKIAKQKDAKIVYADTTNTINFKSDMIGMYQKKNIKTAYQTILTLRERGFNVTDTHIKVGLLNVNKNTGLLGRWQILEESPKVVCDTAHNREGLTLVIRQLQLQVFNKLHIIFGVVNDKDLNLISDLLPKKATYYFCKPNIPRGKDATVLKDELSKFDLNGNAYSSVKEAYNMALHCATKEDFIFIGGSTFVVAEII